ncbi:MAG: thioesterase family protein [Bacteroidales bacterium]|nr:thioesterase family protein [Bacteroidales bacterium]
MLTIGIEGCIEQTVDPAQSAAAIGSGLVDVFATPMMIALMERTCNESVVPYLDEGLTTVGTHIDISHTAATPIGMKVRCKSELIEIDGRRLVFSVAAYDEAGVIGEGKHERFIVDRDKFQSKANSKLQNQR